MIGCRRRPPSHDGTAVAVSLRGSPSALATTQAAVSGDTMDEAGFYGDLFDPAGPTAYACQSHRNYNAKSAMDVGW